jgi:hypothetical protein
MPAAGAAIFISASVGQVRGVVGIDEEGDAAHIRDRLAQHLQPLGAEVGTEHGIAGDVSAWAGEAGDQARAHRIANADHDDGNGRRGLFGGVRRRCAEGRDHVDRAANKLGRDLR